MGGRGEFWMSSSLMIARPGGRTGKGESYLKKSEEN